MLSYEDSSRYFYFDTLRANDLRDVGNAVDALAVSESHETGLNLSYSLISVCSTLLLIPLNLLMSKIGEY